METKSLEVTRGCEEGRIKSYCLLVTEFGVVLVCQGCCNKVPQTEWLKQQKFMSHGSGARSPRSGCRQSHASPKGIRGEFVPGFLASGSSLTYGSITPVFTRSSPWVCVSIPPFYKDTNHTGLGSTLLQYDLVLTHDIHNNPISK